ncbi:hypothetical protein D3C72_61070 [compost metagenome]
MDSDFLFANAKHIWARGPNGALVAIIHCFQRVGGGAVGGWHPCAKEAQTG